jgi:hypothetical protein
MFSGVNQETIRLAPPEAMQFGRALQRLLTHLVHANPKFGPAKLAKIDVADGFYRIGIRTVDIPKLGVILPHSPLGGPLVAFPLALPMGWVESPPFFMALTETACDLANAATQSGFHSPLVHPLESISQTPAPSPPDLPASPLHPGPGWSARTASFDASTVWIKPLAIVDVYVDDFLLAAQTKRAQLHLLRNALRAIDSIFRPLDPSVDPPPRKHSASIKKMEQGDAHWSYRKRMLGWVIDTVSKPSSSLRTALTGSTPSWPSSAPRENVWLLPSGTSCSYANFALCRSPSLVPLASSPSSRIPSAVATGIVSVSTGMCTIAPRNSVPSPIPLGPSPLTSANSSPYCPRTLAPATPAGRWEWAAFGLMPSPHPRPHWPLAVR